jgi:hypothetical protein
MYDINNKTAYFFGFFWGDGGMKSNNRPTNPRICIVKEDAENLYETFKECFEFSYSEYAQPNRKIRSTFYFKDKALKAFLLEMDGLNKSYLAPTKILKAIPEHLHKYFWRGYIDADGCFYKCKNKKSGAFSISSTINQDWSEVKNLFSYLEIENFSIFEKKTKSGNSSSFEVKYGPDIKKVGNFIYGSKFDGIGLKRKFDKFTEISDSLEKLTSNKKGISFHKGNKKWRAYVKRQFLGWWNTEEEAYSARIKFLAQKSVSEKY